MSYLTESLKIEILMMIGYGDRARTQCEVVRLFRETHPDLPPLNQGTISKIEAQYQEMGHVRKVPSKRQAVVDDDTKAWPSGVAAGTERGSGPRSTGTIGLPGRESVRPGGLLRGFDVDGLKEAF
ncbi:hypothetical protein NQ318_015070 [Aromia moschata]|uniref:DUF4817 domain-containing protein n=1 Tax=Aromia moschata TaxID=1265417 RepID=A0AAV8YXN2_9CUCU|nr:hypothetical protein NQ318_015070 [Aromia moschata]